MIRKAMQEISEIHDDVLEEGMMFLESMWALILGEVKSPRHLDKYMLAFMLLVSLYVLASCGEPAF